MSEHPLKDKWIIITRPEQQASAFAKNIEKVGGCPFYFPLIEITPLNNDSTREKLLALENYDIVIFVSANAVVQSINLVGTEIFANKVLVTVGKKTAEVLAQHDLSVDFCPERLFNSEALLAIDEFKKESAGKKIAIIRGSTGRDYLKNNLIALGADVDYIDVYKRHCPQQNLDALKAQWENGKLDVVILTSASSTASFFDLAKDQNWLNKISVLIGSPRMQHEIPSKFRGKILISEDPSDETLFTKLTLAYG